MCFITLPRRVAKSVGKLGTRLQTGQLRCKANVQLETWKRNSQLHFCQST